jgi:hypothetical protein
MNSKQPLLLLRMEPVGDLLGDQGGVALGTVVDNEGATELAFQALLHALGMNGAFSAECT